MDLEPKNRLVQSQNKRDKVINWMPILVFKTAIQEVKIKSKIALKGLSAIKLTVVKDVTITRVVPLYNIACMFVLSAMVCETNLSTMRLLLCLRK
ncbi:hypothetical protein THF1C08_20353 [Vibrio jasicida]|uniref:Uncharacterized protein n=1 Tax=Vibrio jasicida TaxID=766224 RepID=A0AAU9QLX2_9VIBR|nr:hypothetical protein THF1C08_20353 [Vibrio jasicida]CAH1587090.1 hypothetical protein THF1A12_20355 [Vibrio jasicida]